jgi:peroxiredoxin
LRQDYAAFVQRKAEVVAIGPEGPRAFKRYWQEQDMPFVGLSDPKHQVADLYGQEVNLLRLGRMPAIMIIDKAGRIRYQHYGDSMSDIPPNAELLSVLEGLSGSAEG